jgi:hypothetical protein
MQFAKTIVYEHKQTENTTWLWRHKNNLTD